MLDVLMSYDHTNGSFDLSEINVTHMATTANRRRFIFDAFPSIRSTALETPYNALYVRHMLHIFHILITK